MIRFTRFSVAARRDVDEYAAYIASDSPDAARRFLHAVRLTAEDLCVFPRIGREMLLARLAVKGVRQIRIIGFPRHLLVYRVSPLTIDVLCITHGARDLPGVMRKFLRDPERRRF